MEPPSCRSSSCSPPAGASASSPPAAGLQAAGAAGRPAGAGHTLAAVRASGLPWHVEDAGHPGMGDSIAAGGARHARAAGWLMLPGDLPLVQPASLRAVAEALAADASVVLPMHRGTRGHPVGFSRVSTVPALQGAQGRGRCGGASRACAPGAEAGDRRSRGILMDIDTVADAGASGAALRAAAQPSHLAAADGGMACGSRPYASLARSSRPWWDALRQPTHFWISRTPLEVAVADVVPLQFFQRACA